MIGEDFAAEYQRVCRIINDAEMSAGERKKAFDAIWGIRKLLEQEQINCDTAKSMSTKLTTAIRFAACAHVDVARDAPPV